LFAYTVVYTRILGGPAIPEWLDLFDLRMGQSYRREVCEIWTKQAKRKKGALQSQ